jgi:hypothetical protein
MDVRVKIGAKDNSPFLFPSLYRKRGKKADSRSELVLDNEELWLPSLSEKRGQG